MSSGGVADATNSQSVQGSGGNETQPHDDKIHLLLDRLELPKLSKRIFYTCIDVCKELVACGANTGSVYLFKRLNILNTNHKLVLVETMASLGEPVTKVAFSPDGQNVALSSNSGTVRIIKLHLNALRRKQQVMQTNTTHKGCVVTSLKWDSDGKKIFAGDEKGVVSSMTLTSNTVSSLFSTPTSVIYRGDSPVVQIDFESFDSGSRTTSWLVISTHIRCVLLKIYSSDSSKGTKGDSEKASSETMVSKSSTRLKKSTSSVDVGDAIQVGRKLRNGAYGACFCDKNDLSAKVVTDSLMSSTSNNSKSAVESQTKKADSEHSLRQPIDEDLPFLIFSTRPGRRIWVANGQTQSVLCTLKPVLEMRQTCFNIKTDCVPSKAPSLEFGKITRFQSSIPFDRLGGLTVNRDEDVQKHRKSLLLSWNKSAILLINADMPTFTGTRVLQWHIDLGSIHDLAVCPPTCEEDQGGFYVLHGESRFVSRILSLSPRQILNSNYSKRMSINWCFENAIECNILSLPVLQELLGRLTADDCVERIDDDLKNRFLEQIAAAKDVKDKTFMSDVQIDHGAMRRNSLKFPSTPGSIYRNSGLLMRSPPQSPSPAVFEEGSIQPTNDAVDPQVPQDFFDGLVQNALSRWNEDENADNTVAKRHYRIKRVAFSGALPEAIPKEIPDSVKSRSDLQYWGEEIMRAMKQENSPTGKLQANFEQAAMEAMSDAINMKDTTAQTKKAKKRRKKASALSLKKRELKSKGKRRGGNRRERLVSIDDLSEEDLVRRSQISNASMMNQRANKNRKVEKALEPLQGAINAVTKSTVSTASKAMKDIGLALNTADAKSNSPEQTDSGNISSHHDELSSIDTPINTALSSTRSVSKPWRQIRKKKQDDSRDTMNVDNMDTYVKQVAKSVAKSEASRSTGDSMNSSSKKTSDIDAKSGSGGGLLGWFTSKSTVVVSSSTQLKDEQICDLRSKRTAHVKYEKIDGFEKVIRITKPNYMKAIVKKKTAKMLKRNPSAVLTSHVYSYVIVHLHRGQLVSAEPVLSAFVQTFSPISEYVASEKDEQLDAKDTLDSESKTTREVSSQNEASKVNEERKTQTFDKGVDGEEGDDIAFQTTRPLTDSERAKAIELVTIYFELHCANQNNEDKDKGIAASDGHYMKTWNDAIAEQFINEYWSYLNIDRVLVTLCKRKSIKVFKYVQCRLTSYVAAGSHRLFNEAMSQNDIDRVFAALEHWQSTYYSLVDDSKLVPPLSCLLQQGIIEKLVQHDAKKASVLLTEWYEWLCPWVLFQVVLGEQPNEDTDIGSIDEKILSWYRKLFLSMFTANVKDANGSLCTKSTELVKFWLRLEVQCVAPEMVDQIVSKYECDPVFLVKLCKKHAFVEGMISLLKSLCRKHDEFHHFGSSITPKHIDDRDTSNTYLASINFAANETVDVLINADNYKSDGSGNPNLKIEDICPAVSYLFQTVAIRLGNTEVVALLKRLCEFKIENILSTYLTFAFRGIMHGIGEIKTTKLISELELRIKNMVPVNVCELIFDFNEKKKNRNQEIQDLLGTLDNYLWKKREPMLGPQIRHLKDVEHEYRYGNRDKVIEKVPKNVEILLSSGGMLMDSVGPINDPFYKFYADEGCHWGAGTSVRGREAFSDSTSTRGSNFYEGIGNECPRCRCPYEPNDQIVVFACGHGVHKDCCKEGICTVCMCNSIMKLQ